MRSTERPWTIGLVAVLATAIRLPAVSSGLPYIWNPDEPSNVRIGATMVDHGSWNPHFFNYPSLLYDVIASLGWVQRLFGGWHKEAGLGHLTFQNEGINLTSDPHLIIALRLVTVVFSVLTCVIVSGIAYLITKRWWAATCSGVLLAVSPLMVSNGVLVAPDTYATLFVALTLLFAVVIMRRGKRVDYVLAGASVGFATGSKYNAVVVAVTVVAAHFLRHTRPRDSVASLATPLGRNRRFRRQVMRSTPLLLAAGAAIVAFLITTPLAVFSPAEVLHGATEPVFLYSTPFVPGTTGSSLSFYIRTLSDQGFVYIVLSCFGVVGLFGKWWRESLVVAIFVVSYGVLMSIQPTHFDRNMLPELPALVVLAVIGVGTLADRLQTIAGARVLATVAVASVIAGLVPPISASAREPGLLSQHPRAESQAWIYRHIPEGSTVVVESYGPWISHRKYRLVEVPLLLDPRLGPLPANSAVVVLTELGSGRFLAAPKTFPVEVAVYQRLLATLCSRAFYSNGPWIRILVPCTK